MADARELRLPRNEPGVAAGLRLGRAADVADVDDEGELLRVHLLDHEVEPLDFAFAIGRVAQDAEHDRRIRRNRRLPGARAQPQDEKEREATFSVLRNQTP